MKDNEKHICNHEGLAEGLHIIHSPYCTEEMMPKPSSPRPQRELLIGEHISLEPDRKPAPSAGT